MPMVLVTVCRVDPVAGSTRLTRAPPMTPPDASSPGPEPRPRVSWAGAINTDEKNKKARLIEADCILLFICSLPQCVGPTDPFALQYEKPLLMSEVRPVRF